MVSRVRPPGTRWRLAIVAVGALMLSSCLGFGADVTTEQHLQAIHPIDRNHEMPYLVWFPDGYGEDRGRRYPLIIFLHATADISYDSAFVMRHGLPAVLAQGEQPEDFDFVVVSPQAVDGAEWWARNVPEWVDGFVEDVLDTYLVDRNRVYLTGINTGGNASWHIAVRYPHRYAAIASVSGSGFGSTVPPTPNACRLKEVPVWGFHGEQDLIQLYPVVRAEVRGWEEVCGATVKWTTYPDTGHFDTLERAYRDPALYDWLLGHTLG